MSNRRYIVATFVWVMVCIGLLLLFADHEHAASGVDAPPTANTAHPDIQRVCDMQGLTFHTMDALCSGFMDARERAVIYPDVDRVGWQSSYADCSYVDGWGDDDCTLAALFGSTFLGSMRSDM